jgi:hypothetical protein
MWSESLYRVVLRVQCTPSSSTSSPCTCTPYTSSPQYSVQLYSCGHTCNIAVSHTSAISHQPQAAHPAERNQRQLVSFFCGIPTDDDARYILDSFDCKRRIGNHLRRQCRLQDTHDRQDMSTTAAARGTRNARTRSKRPKNTNDSWFGGFGALYVHI